MFQGVPEDKVEVLLRLCPIFSDEDSIVVDATGNVIEISKEKKEVTEFAFDSIFDETVSQTAIFKVFFVLSNGGFAPPLTLPQVAGLPLVARIFRGDDAVLFAYGLLLYISP